MTNASNHEDNIDRVDRRPGRRRSFPAKWTLAVAPLFGLAVLVAGCGPNKPGAGGSGSNTTSSTAAVTGSSSEALAQALAYARCVRSHGVPGFPDPVTSPGGGVAFQINGGPGSDLNRNNPTFEAAKRACQSLWPPSSGGQPAPAPSAQKLAAEVKYARCMRSHGLPNFPDPNAQGVFDSSRFNENSPGFQAASEACQSLEPKGPIGAAPGPGPR
jgi:hypothetical protein